MAAPADITSRGDSRSIDGNSGEVEELRQQLNALIAAMRVLAAKLDADAGVTDTNYFALTMDAAASGPSKVLVAFG